MIIRVKQPVPEYKNYTVFIVFNREVCGLDFMKKMFNWEYPKLRLGKISILLINLLLVEWTYWIQSPFS